MLLIPIHGVILFQLKENKTLMMKDQIKEENHQKHHNLFSLKRKKLKEELLLLLETEILLLFIFVKNQLF